jgi:hypothetical protein
MGSGQRRAVAKKQQMGVGNANLGGFEVKTAPRPRGEICDQGAGAGVG